MALVIRLWEHVPENGAAAVVATALRQAHERASTG
jgi:hypothetical protein